MRRAITFALISEPRLVFSNVSSIFRAVSFAALALSHTTLQLCLVLVPLAFAGSLLATVNTAQLTKAAPRGDAGTVLSLDMAVSTAARVVAPSLGTGALQAYGFPAVGALGSAVMVALLGLLAAGWLPTTGAAGQGGGAREEGGEGGGSGQAHPSKAT